MGKLIVRIASLLLIAAFLPTAVLAAEWNLENGSIEITATANAEGGTTQTVSQGGSSAEDSNPTITSNGNQTSNTITIKADDGTTANVTIKDTNIRAGGTAIKTACTLPLSISARGLHSSIRQWTVSQNSRRRAIATKPTPICSACSAASA